MGAIKSGKARAPVASAPIVRPELAALEDEERAAIAARVAELKRDPVLYAQVRELFDVGLIHGWRSLVSVHVPQETR